MTQNHEFTPPHPLNTAVLFLVFNRPDTTRQVFEAIRQAKPPRLYVAADGARNGKPGEAERVRQVRDYVMNNMDWDCEVHTLFRNENLGCKYAVSGAITWFFEQEEQGIILEDDCLPSQSFFWFCEDALSAYRNDLRVGQITGFNRLISLDYLPYDVFFSKYPAIWGWATWADRWKNYDVDIIEIFDPTIQKTLASKFTEFELEYRMRDFREVHDKKIDTWDFQWAFHSYLNGWNVVVPKYNMIKNVGFGEFATHTVGKDPWQDIKVHENVKFVKIPNYMPVINDYEVSVAGRSFDRGLVLSMVKKIKRIINNI